MHVRVSEEVVLPVQVARAWEYLGNTQHLVELDPLLGSYEPETGVMRATRPTGSCRDQGR